jgi:hypothetical protein
VTRVCTRPLAKFLLAAIDSKRSAGGETQLAHGTGIVQRPRRRLRWIAVGRSSNSGADAPPALGVPVGPRPSGQATNSRALPDPPDCEFDLVNGVTNILVHQHCINIEGERQAAALSIFFPMIKEALSPALTAVIPALLPLREAVPELAYLHREERVHSKIQPVPYDLCTHSEQEP